METWGDGWGPQSTLRRPLYTKSKYVDNKPLSALFPKQTSSRTYQALAALLERVWEEQVIAQEELKNRHQNRPDEVKLSALSNHQRRRALGLLEAGEARGYDIVRESRHSEDRTGRTRTQNSNRNYVSASIRANLQLTNSNGIVCFVVIHQHSQYNL